MKIDPYTFGNSRAAISLSEVLNEINDSKLQNRICKLINKLGKLINSLDNNDIECKLYILKLIQEDIIKSINEVKCQKTIVKSLAINIIKTKIKKEVISCTTEIRNKNVQS